jgi:pimeloyl-ACP methyl ester carboxylesterase
MNFFQSIAKRIWGAPLPPFKERYYNSTDGLNLYYRDYPRPSGRTPILCIPGLTRNSRDFDFIASHMAATRRVIVADLRGRGKSEYAKDPRHYTVAIEAADMIRLLDNAQIEKTIVLGTSRGGIVAMTMAATRPDTLKGVILNDIGGELEALGLSRIWEFIGREPPMNSWAAATAALRQNCEAIFPNVDNSQWVAFARALYREEDGRIVPDYDPRLGDAVRQNVPTISPDGPRVPLWSLFSALARVPALVLRGENSDLLSADTLQKMHSVKRDLRSMTIKQRGHAPFLNETEAVAAIDGFLSEIS